MKLDGVKLGFIGGGNMAKALVEGILERGLVNPSQIIISSPSKQSLLEWKSLSVATTVANYEVISFADLIFLSVKPNQLENALINSKTEGSLSSKLFVSVLAGTPLQQIYDKLVIYVQLNPRLIRVMPNTSVKVGEGCSAIAAHRSATESDVALVTEIFSAVGLCEVVPEYLIPAVTGLTGSGPAYIYMIIQALSDGAVKQGLPRNLATAFAAQTVMGSAKMVLHTGKHPAQLKEEVCSAGGTTIYGLHELEKGGLNATLMNAVEAAVRRGEELSYLSGK